MATQMMYSMRTNIRPTNAEVTDVSNAVLAGCDAIMTSEETTMGKYPVETIKNMAEICEKVESYYRYDHRYDKAENEDITSIIARSAVNAGNELDSKLIVTQTMSGYTAKKISNLRPKANILAIVPTDKVAKSLNLRFGVCPTIVPTLNTTDEMVNAALDKAKNVMNLESSDTVIITGGLIKDGTTNFLKIAKI